MAGGDDARSLILARRARFLSAALAAAACGAPSRGAESAAPPVVTVGDAKPAGEASSGADDAAPPAREPREPVAEASEPGDGSRPCSAQAAQGRKDCRVVMSSSCHMFILQQVSFDPRSKTPTSGSSHLLDATAEALKSHPEIKLRVEGHIDDTEPKKLGLSRAEAVRDELVQRGIDSARLKTVNAGKTKPRQAGKSSSARAANRRVEFFVEQ